MIGVMHLKMGGCHGTGTALGDPIEVGALKAVFSEKSSFKLHLGAGKSNHGHLEGAAGFAGLLKVFGSLENATMTPNIHFDKLNPHISLTNSRLSVPEASNPLLKKISHMGVSSFGFGGTNAHAIIATSRTAKPKKMQTRSRLMRKSMMGHIRMISS